jgi:hypothetical protein
MEPVPSFASVAEADTYNAAHLFGTAWAPLTTELKTRALFTATQLINMNVKLAVPTDGSVAIPQSLKNATSEYARILATDDSTNPAEAGGTEGIKRLKAGSIELEFTAPKVSEGLQAPAPYVTIPAHVLAMIAHLIVGLVSSTSTMFPVKNV